MRCTVVLEFDSDGGPKHRVEVVRLHRDEKSPREGDVGMTLCVRSAGYCVDYTTVIART